MAFTGFVSFFYRVFTGFCATFIGIYRIYRILQDLSHSKFTTSGLRGRVPFTRQKNRNKEILIFLKEISSNPTPLRTQSGTVKPKQRTSLQY